MTVSDLNGLLALKMQSIDAAHSKKRESDLLREARVEGKKVSINPLSLSCLQQIRASFRVQLFEARLS